MIWFDASDVLDWWRPPVGIIRAGVQIGSRLSTRLGSRLRFCRYLNGTFVQVPLKEFEAQVDALRSGKISSLHNRRLSPVQRMQSVYGIVLNHGPFLVREPLRLAVRLVKRICKSLRSEGGASQTDDARPALHETSEGLPSFIRPGDTYVSLGQDWEIARQDRLNCRSAFRWCAHCALLLRPHTIPVPSHVYSR